ncbi:hypothetical protein TRAPUB_3539 [Trametes pubescens]|uniref:Uncharacterized protein n=1 Tax=Trametes pubescens TaxID=154538 RepID=A0A1M2VDJ5_TRAPU|nr:hypothetical protein TRAPUB_3539 [Trametes pubescens]
MAVSFSLNELLQLWHAPSNEDAPPPGPLSWTSTASVLVLSLAGLLWTLSRKSAARTRVLANGTRAVCPPEQLKDDLPQGTVLNAYTLERELTVPFDVEDVRVAKILVHPIKVGLPT